MFGFFRRQVLLPPPPDKFSERERGGGGGRGRGEEVFCSVVLFRYEANSFFWSWKLLRSSLFPETRDGLLTGYSEACLKRSFFFTG